MGSTIVYMMRRVHLSIDDLRLLEFACRASANQYRKDAERQGNPTMRGIALETAEKYDSLAERMRRFGGSVG